MWPGLCGKIPGSTGHGPIRRARFGVLPRVLQPHPHLSPTLCPSPVCICQDCPPSCIQSRCLISGWAQAAGGPSGERSGEGACTLPPCGRLCCREEPCFSSAAELGAGHRQIPGLSSQLCLDSLDCLASSRPVSKTNSKKLSTTFLYGLHTHICTPAHSHT